MERKHFAVVRQMKSPAKKGLNASIFWYFYYTSIPLFFSYL